VLTGTRLALGVAAGWLIVIAALLSASLLDFEAGKWIAGVAFMVIVFVVGWVRLLR
jgi:hypothetical protein